MRRQFKRLIMKAPVVGRAARWLKRRLTRSQGAATHAKAPGIVFDRQSTSEELDADGRARIQIRNVLNYTKCSGSSYSASRYPAGYHSIEVLGEFIQGQRRPAERLRSVPYDFTGRSVLDIGCNQGGMLFELGDTLKWAVGIDFDHRMINASNRINALQGNPARSFYVFDLETEPLDLIRDLIPDAKVDIVFLLSVCMWIANWREVVAFAASISNAMLFESNGSEKEQAEQREYLESLYSSVTVVAGTSDDDPRQKKRVLMLCE